MKMEDYKGDPIDPDDSDDGPGGMVSDNWGCIIAAFAIIVGFVVWLVW